MEVLTGTVKVVVEKIVGYIITAVGRQMGYLIRYKKNVDNVRNEVVELEDARDGVQRKVQAASYNVEEIEANVQRWLTRVQGINTEVQEFFEEEGQAKLKCFNLKARYQIGRKAHKMGLVVKELKDKADTFHTVGHRVPIGGGPIISTKGYEDFESRKSIFDGVMKALKDGNIPAIGVCGMGGLGKTMLVGKIAKIAIEDKLFERIVTVVVSQTPDLKQIQKDIANQLQISEFKNEDAVFQKAHLLRERLKKEKILLIIDDIWHELGLEDLGIFFGDDHKGSKLLLTSRFRDVLDMYMDAQDIFCVGVLLNNEAEYLFSKIVGDLAENLNLQSTMIEVVKECDGLPIAITTVANALKNKKNPIVWKDALQQLKMANPTQIKGMHDKVYKSIKLSYTFLSEEAQFLFLFCSLFEEDMVIPIALLWRILVGLNFFQDVYKMEEVRNRVHTLVERLKDACLLLEGDGSGTFKMHDVIRDVAIYIADKDKEMLTVRSSDDLEKWSNMKKLKDFIGIALFDVKFSELPKKLECPQLNFILLGDKDNSSAIPNHFFVGMKELKVFVLFEACLSLPSSLSCLHNLQSLVLNKCELEDVAIIGELKNLKALTLSGSNIKRLPIEIGQLTYLQLLDLKRCTKLEVIPPNVLSNLKRLEELYMKSSFNQWQVDGESTKRNNTRVSELDHLSLLTTLCIHIPNAKILPKAMLFGKLERYEILIGNVWDWDRESESVDEFKFSKMVKLELDRRFQAEDGIIILLKRCEYLDLAPKKGIKNILYEVDKEGFPQLKHLYVRNSTEIQYIVNLMGFQRVVFPLLEFLSLDNMTNLEKLCHGHDQLAMGSFRSLKKLEVSNCDELKFVFFLTMLGCFSQLQEIVIRNCKVMSAIVAKERKHEIQVNNITDDVKTNMVDFSQLRSLDLRNLPNLMGFYSDVDSQLLFSEKVAFSNLEKLFINCINSLKMLWHNQLISDSFCKLNQLHVDQCENLMNIFPPNMLRRLQNLKDLRIRNCNSVEEVFEIRQGNVDEIYEKRSTQLKVLNLASLPKLKHVWTLDPEAILTFQNLCRVEVSKCETLKSLFPISVAKSLEQLESLHINDCELMEEIVALKEGLESTTKFVFPQLTSLTLESLPELKCFYSGKHTSEWPSLKILTIRKCGKVKSFASNGLSFSNTDGLGHHVPVQQPLFPIEKVAFFNLERIFIYGIDNLKMLWPNYQVVPDSFCKIKKLHVGSCKNLINIFPPNMLTRLQNLEELKVEDCNLVEEVFEVRGENVNEICDKGSTQFGNLNLINLPKNKHLWTSDPEAILTFQNLHQVEVSKCKTLKSLFPVSVAKGLEQLRSLRINDCELMEEIVALEEGLETPTRFVFPQVTSLTLELLPELKCFYPKKHTLEWPSLKSLMISKCDKMKIVALNELSFKDTDELGDHVPVQQPLFLIEKVAFFNLERIFINGIDNLKVLWHNHQPVPDYFCKIKNLDVRSCKNLMNIFPPNMSRRLWNFEDLQIRNCNSVEEVFEVRGENVDEICDEGSTQLVTLTLINLPKLKHVWTSDLEAILTFQNLRQVEVSKCKTLKSLFPILVAKSLEQLGSLRINDCELMEEIVALEEGLETPTKFVFPQVTSLTLELLPELKCFYPKKHTLEWPSLKSLMISKCDKMKIVALNELSFKDTDELGDHVPVQQPLFLIEKVAFFNLERIFINGIDNLKMLWHNYQLIPDSFCNIKTLHVGSCRNLMNIFPPNMLRRLQNLEELKIEDCNSVEEVFEVRGENVDEICDEGSTQLGSLTLINLPKLKHVWTSDPEAILTFQNLRQVEVSKCKTLKSLFPILVAKSLEQLGSLRINDCELMEEIVALEEGLETATKFVFPQVTSLTLESLPELKCFYPRKHTLEWPSLKILTISKCDKVKIVALNELSFKDTVELGDHVLVQQPLFLIEKDAFPNLKELNLDLNETMNQTNGRLSGEFFCKLEVLRLYGKDDKLIAVPSVFVEGLRYLKSLSVSNVFFDNEGQYAGTFERLTELCLYKMPKLIHLWKENSEQGRALQNLEILDVSECGRLKNLVPSSMYFQNLYTLSVSKCHGLISLATPSTVKSLVQLKELYIYGCKRMREIVTNEGEGEAGDEICFNQLYYLGLDDLPTLRSFHLGNRTIKFPSLEYLYVTRCPEMKIFSNGVLSIPKLKKVGLDENIRWSNLRELLPEEDVNSAIKRFWEENYDPCVQQLFTKKTDASTSEAGEINGVDYLEDDSKED